MLSVILQIWGGGFYLLNKIFLWLAESNKGSSKERKWRIWAWAIYLLGLPAWLVIFWINRNWILGAVELGGAPAMFMGLLIAVRGLNKKIPQWLDRLAQIAVVVGLASSLYDFGGITTLKQWLELGVAVGFLFGTYMLAKKNPRGYHWYQLMNASAAALMLVQGYYGLAVLQVISIGFVTKAYLDQKK